MNKIATPRDLQHELSALLVYARTDAPSRVRIASALNALADRVVSAGTHVGFPKVRGPVYWVTYNTKYKEVTKRFKTRELAMRHAQETANELKLEVTITPEHDYKNQTIVKPKTAAAGEEEAPNLDAAVQRWIAGAKADPLADGYAFHVDSVGRYLRVVCQNPKHGAKGVLAFVAPNGDVHVPYTFTAPAKNKQGNVFKPRKPKLTLYQGRSLMLELNVAPRR